MSIFILFFLYKLFLKKKKECTYFWIFNYKTRLRLYKMNPRSFQSAASISPTGALCFLLVLFLFSHVNYKWSGWLFQYYEFLFKYDEK